MMGEKYVEYQSGGLPWIKEIPAHWNLLRNGVFLKNHSEKVGDKFTDFQLLSLTTTGIKKKSINEVTGKVPESYEGYQKVFQGDMIFCLFDLDCSAVFSGLSDYDGMITSAYNVAKPDENIVNSGYLKYWYASIFAGRYYKIFSKSVRYTINYDAFKTIKAPIPPKSEQDQIVRYLDWKTYEIDRFIRQKRRQIKRIEELKKAETDRFVLRGVRKHKMLKTDIIGLEEIPNDWEVVRNKNLFYERTMLSSTGSERLLSVSKHFGVKPYDDLDSDEQFATIKPAEDLSGYKIVHRNDLVMNIMRARNGSFGISDYDGLVSAAYCVYGLKKECNPKYIHYLLRSSQIISTYEAYAYGICEHRRRLYADDCMRLYSVLPSMGEQNEIVEKITELESQIDHAVKRVKEEIELLQELRTKLIADVVTGQIDVRDEVIPEYDQTEIEEAEDEISDEDDSETESEDE